MQEADFGLTTSAMQPAGGQGGNPDDMLLVKFFIDPLENGVRSKEEGRPIFEDVEWISIRTPGSRNEVRRPVRTTDIDRFPRHYAAFKNREDGQVNEGTPLSEWTGVTRSQVEEMKFWNVITVEQLAGAADSAMSSFRGFVTLKQAAQKWLDASKGNAAVEALAKANETIEALTARLDALEANVKPKRKRRNKTEMEAARQLKEQRDAEPPTAA